MKLEYVMSGFDSCEQGPLPIPRAPIIPSEKEIQVIETYLNSKYPLLLKNSPSSINDSVWLSKKFTKKILKNLKNHIKRIRKTFCLFLI